jgi:hypothetical protein
MKTERFYVTIQAPAICSEEGIATGDFYRINILKEGTVPYFYNDFGDCVWPLPADLSRIFGIKITQGKDYTRVRYVRAWERWLPWCR